ncbi:MAG TPA: hypothetical protein VKR32_13650 [Puia sp.]|nr:hypothetical protein [Puia sp.]
MKPNTQNQQDRLAEKLINLENHVIQESKIALLKIQSWRYAMKTPEIGISYQREAALMITRSLMSFVPNSFVLSEEGFYFSVVEN